MKKYYVVIDNRYSHKFPLGSIVWDYSAMMGFWYTDGNSHWAMRMGQELKPFTLFDHIEDETEREAAIYMYFKLTNI